MRRLAASVALFGALALIGRAQAPRDSPTLDVARSFPPPLKLRRTTEAFGEGGSRADSTGSIRGRVLAADTSRPLRNAEIRLSVESEIQTGFSLDPVWTDSEGRYVFDALTPARYRVSAAKAGYVTTSFGAHSAWDRPVVIALTAGATVERVDIRLQPAGAISGRIVDDLGDPVVGADVTASRMIRVDGRSRLDTLRRTETDDLGEYRFGGLAAGSYVIAAGGGGGRVTRWTPTFYPGTVNRSSARPVVVKYGDEQTAIDFSIAPMGAHPVVVSGIVTDASGAGVGGRLHVGTVQETGDPSPSAMSMVLPPSGQFSVSVEPGEHVLFATGESQTLGSTHMTVGESDVTGVNIVLHKAGRISGRVIFEGANPPPATQVELEARDSLSMWFMINDEPRLGLKPVRPKRDGSFELNNLDGARDLRVRSTPRGWALESISLKGRNLLDVPIEFNGGEDYSPVEVVLTDQETEITGVVTDAGNGPVTDYSLLTFPEDRALCKSSRLRWVRPDQTGHFRVTGLPAGTYLIAVVDDVDDAQWSDSDYLDQFRARATRVTLAANEKKTITLERESR